MLLSDPSQRHSRDTPLHCGSTCRRSHIVLVVRVSTCKILVVHVARVYTWGIWAVAVSYASLRGGICMQTTTVNAVAHAWVCFCWNHLSSHVSDFLATPHSAAEPSANGKPSSLLPWARFCQTHLSDTPATLHSAADLCLLTQSH